MYQYLCHSISILTGLDINPALELEAERDPH
jgi:hypothetical protein